MRWDDGTPGLYLEIPQRVFKASVRGGHKGVAVSQMSDLPATLFTGELFDNNTAVILLGALSISRRSGLTAPQMSTTLRSGDR